MSKIESVDFIHLHCHSEYSALDALPKVEEYVIKAAELGMKGLALSEHGNMRSVVQLFIKSKGKFTFNGEKYDLAPIKPISGIEFYMSPINHLIKGIDEGEKAALKNKCSNTAEYKEKLKELESQKQVRKRYHLLAFAKNNIGYKNLLMLNYLSWKDGFYYRPRIDLELLKQYSEGLAVTTACIGGFAPSLWIDKKQDESYIWLKEMKKLFKDDLYVEIQPHNIEEQRIANIGMIQLADELKIKIVATNDCHYLNKDDYKAHNVLLAIQSHKPLQSADAWRFDDNAFYMKDKCEMLESFSINHPTLNKQLVVNALENTMEIYEKCNVELSIDKKQGILPKVTIPKEYKSPKSYLIKLCKDGWVWRNIKVRAENYSKKNNITEIKSYKMYKDRLKHELDRIVRLRFEKYFLIIHELIWWARNNDIMVGPGRGSSSGSLVCYLIGITSVDPIEYDLLFDRFLNESRIDYPDVDMDFEDTRRKEIFKHLFDKYGYDYVSLVGTFGKLKGKQALQDVSRVHSIDYREVSAVTKHIIIRSGGDARANQSVEDSFKEFDVCKQFDKKYPMVLPFVKKLEGKIRQVGIHACGIQLSPTVMERFIPVEFREIKGEDEIKLWGTNRLKVSGIDWRDSQDLGLVKIDVLGLKTLSVIKEALNAINKRYDKKIDLEKISLEDKNVLGGFTKGDFVGIFQFDSIGMTKTCEKLKFTEFEDIITMNALYRPGGMRCISGDTKIMQNWWDDKKRNNTKRFVYLTIKEMYEKWIDNKINPIRTILSYDKNTGKVVRNEIIKIEKSGIKKVYSLDVRLFQKKSKCNNNPNRTRNLKTSSEHIIMTLDGWKKMGDIEIGDYALVKYSNTVGKSKRKYGMHHISEHNKRMHTLQDRAKFFYKDKCFICGYDVFTDVCHIDKNRNNNSIDNYLILCPNHHREFDGGVLKLSDNKITKLKSENWLGNSYDDDFVFSKVMRKNYEGEVETYDIECKSPLNNYIAGEVVVHNSGLTQHFVNRKIGKEKVEKLHPIYDEITKSTLGILVYQEQLIKCFVNLAGYHPGTADEIRKAVAKSFGVEFINKQKEIFVEGAVKNGMDVKKANELFENISFFGCLTGDTLVHRISANQYQKEQISLSDLYEYQNKPYNNLLYKKLKLKCLIEDEAVVKYNDMIKVVKTGVKKVYLVETESGKFSKSTMEHGYKLKDGWKKLKSINIGDEICVTDFEKPKNNLGIGKGGRSKGKTYKNHGLQKGEKNINYVNGVTGKDVESRKAMVEEHGEKCMECGSTKFIEQHHKDFNHSNNKKNNLILLCRKCHRNKHSHQLKRYTKGYSVRYEKVITIKYLGEEECYDVMMENPNNNFVINDGIIVHNSYAFNKAHAAAYSVIAYWGMYLKVYYPTEFYYALMNKENDMAEILRYVIVSRKAGVDVQIADINFADINFKIKDDKTIISGLADIKGCGIKASNEIVTNQPYSSLRNMVDKVNRRQVHKGVITSLVKAGALRSMYPNIGALLEEVNYDNRKERNTGELIIKPVWEWMLMLSEEDGNLLYKNWENKLGNMDEEQQVKIMSQVCPIPPYKHKIEYYDGTIRKIMKDRKNLELYIQPDENYDNELEFSESGLHRNKGIFIGTLVDIKYNNVGDFHKEEPDSQEKKRIGWGKRYSNLNIENVLGIKRVNVDIYTFPTYRQVIDKGLQTPVLIIGSVLKWSEVIYADIIIDLDHFREIMEMKLPIKQRYNELLPQEKYLLKHPTTFHNKEMKSNLKNIKFDITKGTRQVIVLVTRVKNHWTKKGKKMMFIELEDETSYLSVIAWPECVVRNSNKMKTGMVVKLYIKKNKDGYFIDEQRKIEMIKKYWEQVGTSAGDIYN
jgi:DNA-directed DNA polymerase III PolC